MIVIRKNNKTLTVTRAAFDEYYKPNGWVSDGETTPVEEPVVDTVEDEVVEDDTSDEDWSEFEEEDAGIEKPLSEMNKDELLAKANELGIDVSASNSNKQIREMIKNHSA